MLHKNNEIIISPYDSIDLSTVDILVMTVSKKDVNQGNIADQLKLLNQVEKFKKKFANNVVLFFEGYEEDKRGLYQIPKIRKWIKKLFKQKPHLFYYLCDFTASIAICYLCLIKTEPVRMIGETTVCQFENDLGRLHEVLSSAITYAEKCGDSNEEISAMINRILDAMFRNSVCIDEP
jgi:hypothetical protein